MHEAIGNLLVGSLLMSLVMLGALIVNDSNSFRVDQIVTGGEGVGRVVPGLEEPFPERGGGGHRPPPQRTTC